MKTENLNELEVVETGFEIIDLESFQEDRFGGHGFICVNSCSDKDKLSADK